MRNRYKALFSIILVLVIWITLLNYLPVGNGNWNEKQIQKINSVNDSDKFCFAVASDNKNGFAVFNRILEDINNKNLSFAIDVGDLVVDGEKEKYRIFYNEISKSKVPILTGIGNHDITENGRQNYFDIFGDFYYSFSHDNSLFIVLDDANERNIDEQQIIFLESELKKDFRNKFMFLHVPLFDPRKGLNHSLSDTENAKQIMNLASKYNVTTVFTSHIHGYFREVRDNITYIITGGAGGELLLSDPEHYFYHYIQVCVNNSNINYGVVKFPSPENSILDRYGYTARSYIWYFIVVHNVAIMLSIVILLLILSISYDKVLKIIKKIMKRIFPHRKVL